MSLPTPRPTRHLLPLLALLLAACGTRPPVPATAPGADGVPERRPGQAIGYLDDAAVPDSAALVPPPPEPATDDQARMQAALALHGTPRFTRAAVDADLAFPRAAALFTCALGVEVDARHTPATWRLLRRSLDDAARSTRGAKERYRRPRPFLSNHAPVCTPQDQAQLAGSGSYPSGHAAVGTTWSLVLAAAMPARTDALLARGRQFGQSRVVCNVHWHSDVVEGQFMGMATFARLQGEPAFRADLEAARTELAHAAGRPVPQGCGAGGGPEPD